MRTSPRTTTRPARASLLVAVAVTAVLAVGGCGQQEGGPDAGTDPAADPPASSDSGTGPAPTDDEVCPPTLPEPSSRTAPATQAPSLPAADEVEAAWACGYQAGTGREGGWRLATEVAEVDPVVVVELAPTLEELAPARSDRLCTQELGPRYLLTVSDGTALTGVLVDDFGCGTVRVTDDPASIPAGDALTGPAGFVTALGRAVPPST